MSEVPRFLYAVGQALSARALYAEGHPARERTASVCYERLIDVHRTTSKPNFSFLDGNVLFGVSPVRELRGWEWGQRFDDAGLQRWEMADSVPRWEWDAFLNTLHMRLTSGLVNTEEDVRESAHPSIRFGVIGVKDDGGKFIEDDLPVATLSVSLREEREAVEWVQQRIETAEVVDAGEAEGVIASLAVAMHADSEIVLPLIHLKEYDQYTAAHAINVSVLSMALSEYLGIGARDVRAIGVAGLLHDTGMLRIPKEILSRAGPLRPEDWALVKEHPAHGARLLLRGEPQLDLAAVVAFEHHIHRDGTGYPALHYPREIHFASQLVQVCAMYDAVRTRRAHRDALPAHEAIALVEEHAETQLSPEIARTFARMMRQWERRIVRADDTPMVRATPNGSIEAILGGANGVTSAGNGVTATGAGRGSSS